MLNATDGRLETPVVGFACAAFQGHHLAPWTISHRSFPNNVYKIGAAASALMLAAVLLLPPSGAAFVGVLFYSQLLAQEFHRWSHTPPKMLPQWKRTLQSLACGKVRVLLKHPAKGKEVKAGDVFEFNGAFTARMFRLRINAIQARETRQEAQNTNKRVARDRQYQLDAVIVRIMKTRKMLRHNELIGECMKQVPCAPVRPPWGSMRATSRARR